MNILFDQLIHNNRRFVLYAPSVHTGGGFVLLKALIENLQVANQLENIAILDRRMIKRDFISNNIKVIWSSATLSGRLVAEQTLKENVKPGDIILCFGNLPPLFKLSETVFVFLQNNLLITKNGWGGFSLSFKIRLGLERLWLRLFLKNGNKYIVQTKGMAHAFKASVSSTAAVEVIPFFSEPLTYSRRIKQYKEKGLVTYDFIYVASGEAHKNHKKLIEAWCLLAEEKFYPSLCLTLDKQNEANLCEWIEQQCIKYELKIYNQGSLTHEQIMALYYQSGTLIFPSSAESLGLPLIEARHLGLSVLAAELDYVRDILDPEESFNPHSAVSIARAVKRFLGYEEQPLFLTSTQKFLETLLTNF